MSIKLIYAADAQNGIGYKGGISWRIREDLQLFKQKTINCAIVMGRKTWESLAIRPLPNRHNIIVSSNHEDDRENVTWAYSVEQAIEIGKEISETVWVIGGQEILKNALPYADEVHITRVHGVYSSDTFAPSEADLTLAGFDVLNPQSSQLLCDHFGQPVEPVSQVCVFVKNR